ncbi:MAG: UDP-glucose 4-epimerase GalE [Pseudomonadota bacterium]|nr:UDP-glucose 4-epimerase GalE [Pseudomonadota bacterium]
MSDIILVTGGAGYIGSHTCKALAKAGYSPVVFDNLDQGHDWAVRWGKLEVGDLKDPARLDAVFAAHNPTAVLHFAALASVGESVTDPALYYQNNVAGTLNLLEAMRAHGCDRLIFSSTCAVHGILESMPIREDMPCAPINPYGRSKRMIEEMLADYKDAYSLNWIALRYFNACGADPDGETGEAHDPETHLIPRALMAATLDIESLDLFGTDYPTPDGTAIRDYIHVTDLADAHVAALADLMAGGASGPINIGTGKGISVREIIDAARRVTGKEVPVIEKPRRVGDPSQLFADPSLARVRLGFNPKMSDPDTIIATAWNWHRQSRH